MGRPVVFTGPGESTSRLAGSLAFQFDRGIPTWVPESVSRLPAFTDLQPHDPARHKDLGRPILAILPVRPDLLDWTIVGLSVVRHCMTLYPRCPFVVRINPWLDQLVQDSGLDLTIEHPRRQTPKPYRTLMLSPESHANSCAAPMLAAMSMTATLLDCVGHREPHEDIPGIVSPTAGKLREKGRGHLVIIQGQADGAAFNSLDASLDGLTRSFARVSRLTTIRPASSEISAIFSLLQSADYAISLAPSRLAHVAAFYGVPQTICFMNGYTDPSHHYRPWPRIMLAGRDSAQSNPKPYLDAIHEHARATSGV